MGKDKPKKKKVIGYIGKPILSSLILQDDLDKLLGICKGAKCTIENCRVCKNEMY